MMLIYKPEVRMPFTKSAASQELPIWLSFNLITSSLLNKKTK